MVHQALTSALRNITKKASHPNVLVYEMQKARAKRIYLPDGQLRLIDGGREGDVLALGDGQEGKVKESEKEIRIVGERKETYEPGIESDISDSKTKETKETQREKEISKE